MCKFSLLVVTLACVSVALAEFREPQHGKIHQIQKGVAGPNPYIFLTVPKGRSQALIQGYEVIEEDENENEDFDDDEEDDNVDKDIPQDDNDVVDEDEHLADEQDVQIQDSLDHLIEKDDDDNDDYDEFDNVMSLNLKLKNPHAQTKNAKPTHMMVSREHAGAIMVPDRIIEIEGQSVIDEKTGKPALFLPRAVLDTIPDGSVVALMQRSSDDEAEERANRVIVRRRRKGARRNIKRRNGGNNHSRVLKRAGYKRPKNYRPQNVRMVRRGVHRGINQRRVYL